MEHLENNREFIKGAFAGTIASIVMYLFVEIFRWFGITEFGLSFLAGDTVFTYKNDLLMNIISFIINTGVGVFWGIIISFIFSYVFTSDYYILKTLFFTFCIFFFHLGILDEPFHYPRKIHEQTADLLIILGGYLLYGLILAIILKKLRVIEEP